MPAFDVIHDPVKRALIKDGWTITRDPYTIDFEEVTLFADLGAEHSLGVERGGQKLVVEVKGFRSPSLIQDFKLALGQYLLYGVFLEETVPDHQLYLAVSEEIHATFFQQKAIQFVVQRYQIRLLVVNTATEVIAQWIN